MIIKAEQKRKTKYYPTEQIENDAKQLAGLKKYLEEYTLIKDRQAIEVELFEEYLIYAQILGIAKKVVEEFKKLYPQLLESSGYNYDDVLFIEIVSHRGIRTAETAEYHAISRASSYSSGGGGFSSGGGRRRFIWRSVGGGRRIPLEE